MLRRVAFLRTIVSEEPIAYIIRVAKIGELVLTLSVTKNRSTLHGIISQKIAFFIVTAV
jgi:hypothetical protein